MKTNNKVMKLSEKDKNIITRNENICTDSHGINCTVEKSSDTSND